MFSLERIKRVFRNRAVLWAWSLKEFKARYSGSWLGPWWAVITPWLLAVSIAFVFSHIFGATSEDFSLFVLAGMIPWLFFSTSVTESAQAFLRYAPELRQNIFPRELVPLSCVTANFLNFSVGIIFLFPLFLLAKPHVLFLFPALVLVFIFFFLFVAGLAFFFATLNVFLRDLAHFLSIGMMVWFWITPVFYAPIVIAGPYRLVCSLNPITPFILVYRRILFEAAMPSLREFFFLFALSLLVLGCGYFFFLRKEGELLKKI